MLCEKRAVGPHPVQSDKGMLKEVGKLGFAAENGLLCKLDLLRSRDKLGRQTLKVVGLALKFPLKDIASAFD